MEPQNTTTETPQEPVSQASGMHQQHPKVRIVLLAMAVIIGLGLAVFLSQTLLNQNQHSPVGMDNGTDEVNRPTLTREERIQQLNATNAELDALEAAEGGARGDTEVDTPSIDEVTAELDAQFGVDPGTEEAPSSAERLQNLNEVMVDIEAEIQE